VAACLHSVGSRIVSCSTSCSSPPVRIYCNNRRRPRRVPLFFYWRVRTETVAGLRSTEQRVVMNSHCHLSMAHSFGPHAASKRSDGINSQLLTTSSFNTFACSLKSVGTDQIFSTMANNYKCADFSTQEAPYDTIQ